jgi:hypothetical protein
MCIFTFLDICKMWIVFYNIWFIKQKWVMWIGEKLEHREIKKLFSNIIIKEYFFIFRNNKFDVGLENMVNADVTDNKMKEI